MIVRGVLLALRHAHDGGVVHRDVKPDNIFLADKAGQTIVKLFDFGIAKLRADLSEDQLATRAGIAIGTPTYLSPEQAVGGEITPASDVYSTCIVLYELLVGRAPFESEDPLTLLHAHAGADVPSFGELAPRLRIPDGIEALVRRGLAKRAAERISSAELIAELDVILRAHGIDVEPPLFARSSQAIDVPSPLATPVTGTAVRRATTEPPRRSPRRAVIVICALVIAGASVGLAALLARGGDREPDPASAKAVLTTPAAPTDHQRQLKLALRELQDGPTCIARKKAIAKLVELQDSNALPAIKKARAQLKPNACLRAAADQAIKALSVRI